MKECFVTRVLKATAVCGQLLLSSWFIALHRLIFNVQMACFGARCIRSLFPYRRQALLRYIRGLGVSGAVLIFLPGWSLIMMLYKHLMSLPDFG